MSQHTLTERKGKKKKNEGQKDEKKGEERRRMNLIFKIKYLRDFATQSRFWIIFSGEALFGKGAHYEAFFG